MNKKEKRGGKREGSGRKSINEVAKIHLGIRVSQNIYAAIELRAAKNKMSKTEVVESILAKELLVKKQ